MLVDHVLDSQNAGLLESILMPFDIYNDSAQQALVVLKQRFLYDEIEAEVLEFLKWNLMFDFEIALMLACYIPLEFLNSCTSSHDQCLFQVMQLTCICFFFPFFPF